MNDRVSTLLASRRKRLETALGRELELPPGASDASPPSPEEREYLLEEAEDLYWNELEWERITEEERIDEGSLTELAFPGFLAIIRGLLLEEALPDAGVPARPRPEVVEDVLRFLARRVVELRDEIPDDGDGDPDEVLRMNAELAMTERLLDLVLFELYDLGPEEVERVEIGSGSG